MSDSDAEIESADEKVDAQDEPDVDLGAHTVMDELYTLKCSNGKDITVARFRLKPFQFFGKNMSHLDQDEKKKLL